MFLDVNMENGMCFFWVAVFDDTVIVIKFRCRIHICIESSRVYRETHDSHTLHPILGLYVPHYVHGMVLSTREYNIIYRSENIFRNNCFP